MKILRGLLAVTLILVTFGMGLPMDIDAPAPAEEPKYVDLFLHTADDNNVMNTTHLEWINHDSSYDITFTLEHPLNKDLFVEDPQGDAGMKALVWLIGADSNLQIDIYDNSVDGILVGSGSYGPFNYGTTPQLVEIDISFETGHNFTFIAGHSIICVFDFETAITGRLYYDSGTFDSHISLRCKPVINIAVETYNLYNEPANVFYPNDIDFPEDRKQIRIRGKIANAFNYAVQDGENNVYYISHVELNIRGPQTDITKNSTWDPINSEYSYTWNYGFGKNKGKYTITAHVFDEQNNEFTASNTFNMSEFGVVLTSPSQVGGEGTYKAEAKRNVIEGSSTLYEINVYNVGFTETGINITTTGPSGWNWWLEGDNITNLRNQNKDGDIENIPTGLKKSIKLGVNSLDKPLGSTATITIIATCSEDTSEDDKLDTISRVVLKYDIKLEFNGSGDKKTRTKTVEMGDEVDYEFKVTNTGGVKDTIWIFVGNPPSGWDKSLTGDKLKGSISQYYVELDQNEDTDLTLTLETPTSGGDITVNIDITAESKGSFDQGDDPVVSDKITATAIMTSGIDLELLDPPEKYADPEEQIDFEFRLTNTGTSLANFTVTYASPGGEWSINDIYLGENRFTLNGGGSQTFKLYVEPSLEVIAENYTIFVSVYNNENPTRNDEEKVYCIVNEIPSLELIEPDPSNPVLNGETEPGSDVTYIIKIKNTGNMRLNVRVVISGKPGDWTVDFGNASSSWSEDMEPQQEEEITLIFKVPDDAEGDETVDISVEVVPNQGDSILIETHTKIKAVWFQPLLMLLVPILLFVVIVVMVIVIYRRR